MRPVRFSHLAVAVAGLLAGLTPVGSAAAAWAQETPPTEPVLLARGPRFLLAKKGAEPQPIDVERTPVLRERISLDLENVSLDEALSRIAREAGIRLVYSGVALDLGKRVSLRTDGLSVAAALTEVLLDANVDVLFAASGREAVIVKRGPPAVGAITGRVTDAKTGEGLAGAEVLLEGTRWRTLAEEGGQYRIADVEAGSYTLLARRIAYEPARRAVTVTDGQETIADVALQPAAAKLGEIVVTAQKRDERAFDVPISIVAMSAEELQQRKATSLDDLSLAVPGLQIQSTGTSARYIALRGVSNFSGNSSLVGLYLDEASVTSGPFRQLDLRTYDLERVEVLRGPQGTLYGEGSVGGTIRFITRDPLLDRFAMRSDVAALYNTEDGSPGQRIEGALSVPLIENELALRIAGTFDHQGGWINQPAANRKDFNDQKLVNVRAKGLWQPARQFTVNAMAVIHRNDAPPNLGEDANGNYTQTFNLTTTPMIEDNYDVYNLTLTYDFPAVRVLNTTSYVNQDKEVRDLGSRRQFTPPGTPAFHSYLPLLTRSSEVFTEELRLTSIASGPWRWTIGGFYRHARFDDGGSFLFALPGPPGTPLPDPFPFESSNLSESWAVFGDMNYELTDRLTLGTGLRYFQDDQEDRISGQTGTFNSLNPRVYAQYKWTDQVNTYASAAKGFRSGGFNFDAPPFDPEAVWTYELGTKSFLLDGRLSADVAIFYSDYTDYQIVGIVGDPPLNITSNAGDATIKGIEWGLTWRPADQWSLSFNGNYVDSRFVEINAASSSHAVGDPPSGFPKYGYTVSAKRDFKWNGNLGFARLDYNEHGRMTSRNRSIGPWYFDESDIINMLNFTASLPWNDNLSLALFAQNLLNDRGFTDPSSIEESASRSRPRTFGIGFGVTF